MFRVKMPLRFFGACRHIPGILMLSNELRDDLARIVGSAPTGASAAAIRNDCLTCAPRQDGAFRSGVARERRRVREADARNLHVRFDERRVETGPWSSSGC
jgi:hypothetical protein